MNSIIQNTFSIPIQENFLIYSPLNGITALLNRAGLIEFKKQLQHIEKGKGNTNSKLHELAHEVLNNTAYGISRKSGEFNPEFLGIIPTRNCNGACNYCDFGIDKISKKKMSFELAIQTVDWYINLMAEQNRSIAEFHFFGGEPMVAQDVLEVTIHRARMIAAKNNIFPYFEISTNGQYNAKKARWLGNYFNMVVLSFDGFEQIQNIHRPLKENKSSFENAFQTAKIIGESNAELSIRCCISQLNIQQMGEITHWFCQNFRLSALNFEILCSTDLTKKKGLFPPNPIEFAIEYQKSKEIAKSYGIEVVYASDISQQPQVTSCPVGKDTAIVSPNGRINNCYLMPGRWQKVGLQLDFGFISSSKNVELNQSKLEAIRKMVEEKPRCNTCFCKWSCAGGCHVGNTYPECSNSYDNFCLQTRIISAFTLLNDMGMQEKVDGLLESNEQLMNLASQNTDWILDFKNEI